ncbi:hypothetical protein CORC01_05387 [Colletotrichum orchidophilum]|uniref:Uncharacterized protein n=1 Tax=Colletotrichum orchidophilum TaxID=1209926 RepID=A0A1G4BDD9_9PEZI|nr:uncharacterized protein CORC01_05387 [Colletotrichum orchidophilum]OHE99346.1 hypothetical protein CORC01_05387 [Colletotrichum orchidophilum]
MSRGRAPAWDAGRVDQEDGGDGKAGAGWNGEQNWRWTGSSYDRATGTGWLTKGIVTKRYDGQDPEADVVPGGVAHSPMGQMSHRAASLDAGNNSVRVQRMSGWVSGVANGLLGCDFARPYVRASRDSGGN